MLMAWRELRLAVRRLRHSPGFTVAAVLMLALGIGATVTIFTIVNGVLLKPLAYPHSQQLVNIREVVEEWKYPTVAVNAKHFDIWRQRSAAFSGWALLQPGNIGLSGDNGPAVIVPMVRCSDDLFSLLGSQPMLGRAFTAEEMQDGRNHVVVLTSRIWRTRFGRDPHIVGKTIRLNGYPYMVVGVLPGQFELSSDGLDLFSQDEQKPELFVPLVIRYPDNFNFEALARLKPGISLQQATAQLNAIQADIANHSDPFWHNFHLRARVFPLKETVVGGVTHGLWLLFGGVGCVLLIVCINLANLQLVRGILRSRETAVRAAVGASRGDLLAHSLAESLILAVMGGSLGVLLCSASLRLLPYLLPITLPRTGNIKLDVPVLAFALLATTITVLLAGLLPALRSVAVDPQSALQGAGNRSAGTRHSARLRSVLVSAEVLCSTALLLIAALLAKSFVRLMSVDRGFQTEHILTMWVDPPKGEYEKDDRRNGFYDEAMQRLSHLPGLESAGFSSAPLVQGETWVSGLTPLPASSNTNGVQANIRWASPDFLRAVGIRLIAGRMFSDQDRGKPTAVISASAARQLWPGEDAVGRSFEDQGWDNKRVTVVGVIADARTENLSSAPIAIVYFPYWQLPPLSGFFALRTAEDPMTLAASVRKALRQIEPDAAITHVETMDELVGSSVAQRRFEFALLMGFAGAALLLAALGLYGVLSYSVAERTREFGVRIALGAPREALYRLVFHQAAMPVVAGVAGGLAAAWLSGRLIASLLFDVKPYDLSSALLVVIMLAATTVSACYWPARPRRSSRCKRCGWSKHLFRIEARPCAVPHNCIYSADIRDRNKIAYGRDQTAL